MDHRNITGIAHHWWHQPGWPEEDWSSTQNIFKSNINYFEKVQILVEQVHPWWVLCNQVPYLTWKSWNARLMCWHVPLIVEEWTRLIKTDRKDQCECHHGRGWWLFNTGKLHSWSFLILQIWICSHLDTLHTFCISSIWNFAAGVGHIWGSHCSGGCHHRYSCCCHHLGQIRFCINSGVFAIESCSYFIFILSAMMRICSACGEKSVMWRNFTTWQIVRLRNSPHDR